VHETVSPLTNRFLSVIGSQTLGFGRRRYVRLFFAIAGLLAFSLYVNSLHKRSFHSKPTDFRPPMPMQICCK